MINRKKNYSKDISIYSLSITLIALKSPPKDCPQIMALAGSSSRIFFCTSERRVVTGSKIAFVMPLNLISQ